MLPSTVHLSLSFYLLFVVKFFPFAIRPLSLSLSVTLQLCPSLYPRTADTHTSIIQYMDSCCHPQKALSPLSLSLSLSLSCFLGDFLFTSTCVHWILCYLLGMASHTLCILFLPSLLLAEDVLAFFFLTFFHSFLEPCLLLLLPLLPLLLLIFCFTLKASAAASFTLLHSTFPLSLSPR